MNGDDFDRVFSRHCRALDLEWPFDLAVLRTAKRDHVHVWHPDKHQSNERLRRYAEEKLKRINLAYEALRKFVEGPSLCDRCDGPRASATKHCTVCHRAAEHAKELDAAGRRVAAAEAQARQEAARAATANAAKAKAEAELVRVAATTARAQKSDGGPTPPPQKPGRVAPDFGGRWAVNDGQSYITFTRTLQGYTYIERNPLEMVTSNGAATQYIDGLQLVGQHITGIRYQIPLRFDGTTLSGVFARAGRFGLEHVPITLRRV